MLSAEALQKMLEFIPSTNTNFVTPVKILEDILDW